MSETIVDITLPGAVFYSQAAYREFAPERRRYEAAVAAYAAAMDPAAIERARRLHIRFGLHTNRALLVALAMAALSDDLLKLGYTMDEIERHAENPGWRDSAAFEPPIGCSL